MVTDIVPSAPPVLSFNFIVHWVQQSHCSSSFHRVLRTAVTHALALPASQFVHKKKSPRMYTTSMHSGGSNSQSWSTYTRLEDNLIRHRGDPTDIQHDGAVTM